MEEEKIVPIVNNTDIVKQMHTAALTTSVQNDDEIKEKFIQQAKESVEAGIQQIKNENEAQLQKTMYDANKEACRCYGIESDVPVWQVRFMKFGHGLWFVIYFIFATCTICPINVFFKGIQSFIKSTWLAVLIGVVCYLLIIVGLPILVAYLNSKGIQIKGV